MTFEEIYGDKSKDTYNGTLDLSNNKQLTSLDGCYKRITGTLFIGFTGITNFKGTLKEVTKIFAPTTLIETLEGLPDKLDVLDLGVSKHLKSLEGLPKKIRLFNCYGAQLKGPISFPSNTDTVVMRKCNLTKMPEFKNKDMLEINVSINKITSLEGLPNILFDLNCSDNNIKSLKGAPKVIKNDFNCLNNPLESLDYLPDKIGGTLAINLKRFKNDELVKLYESDINKIMSDYAEFDKNYHTEKKLYKKLGKEKYLKIKKLQGVLN